MELRVLRYFLTVAREENISKAAEMLYITQPTLSRQLQELEKELDAQLFIRGKRKITLTDEGMLLRRRAEEMVELEEKLTSEFKSHSENLSGEVSIGAAEIKACELLPIVIDSFKKKYPLVKFNIYSDIATHVKERLDRGIDDFGILIEPGNIDKYDFVRLDCAEHCGILVNSQNPLAQKQSVTIKDIINTPVVVSGREEVNQFYREQLGREYDNLNVITTFNLINNAAFFAIQNKACVLTIEGAVANYSNPSLKFVPFSPEISQSSFIVWKKYQTMSRTVKAFLDELIKMTRAGK